MVRDVFSPPLAGPGQFTGLLREQGFAVLDAATVRALAGADGLEGLAPDWDRLAPDRYLKDGGRYRRRRHASFVIDGAQVRDAPARPHHCRHAPTHSQLDRKSVV